MKISEVPTMKDKKGISKGGAVGLTVAIIAVLFVAAWFSGIFPHDTAGTGGAKVAPGVPQNIATQCQQNPAYTYSAVDAFTSSVIPGTDEIKNGLDAPVTTLANPTAGAGLSFWLSNASEFCDVATANAQCGSTTLQTKCIQNGTVTLATRDLDNDVTLTDGGGANNLTVGANSVYNLEVRYSSAAKKAVMPFGGCVAVEYPATLGTVNFAGAGVGGSCPYKWTYTVNSASNTYQLIAVPDGFDKNGVGDQKKITMQIQTGSTNVASGIVYVTFAPANYYIGNDGAFHLGIEKDANQDTTKTITGGGDTTSFGLL